jgi:hypothetical protein
MLRLASDVDAANANSSPMRSVCEPVHVQVNSQ